MKICKAKITIIHVDNSIDVFTLSFRTAGEALKFAMETVKSKAEDGATVKLSTKYVEI